MRWVLTLRVYPLDFLSLSITFFSSLSSLILLTLSLPGLRSLSLSLFSKTVCPFLFIIILFPFYSPPPTTQKQQVFLLVILLPFSLFLSLDSSLSVYLLRLSRFLSCLSFSLFQDFLCLSLSLSIPLFLSPPSSKAVSIFPSSKTVRASLSLHPPAVSRSRLHLSHFISLPRPCPLV